MLRTVTRIAVIVAITAMALPPASGSTADAVTPGATSSPEATPRLFGGGAPAVPGALLLMLDASGSMKEPDGTGSTRIETAKGALVELVDSLPPELPVGLRVFGARVPSADKEAACLDTENVVPVEPDSVVRLRGRINSTQALGETPIGLSLTQGAADLPDDRRGAIVLVSDGLDECVEDGLGPPPCDIAADLGRNGLRVEVVGLQVEPAGQEQLRCIARATGGRFINVSDVTDLGVELSAAQDRAQESFQVSGTPVNGGPSLIDATELDEGSFSDGIVNDDIRWYTVRAVDGDRLNARLTIATGEAVPEGAGVQITWTDENARVVSREVIRTTGRGQAVTTAVATGILDGDAVSSGAVLDPGLYFLAVEVTGFPEDVDTPFVLDIVRESTAPAPPLRTAPPTVAPEPADDPDGSEAAGLPPPPPDLTGLYLVLAAVGVAALSVLLWSRYRTRRDEEPVGYE